MKQNYETEVWKPLRKLQFEGIGYIVWSFMPIYNARLTPQSTQLKKFLESVIVFAKHSILDQVEKSV